MEPVRKSKLNPISAFMLGMVALFSIYAVSRYVRGLFFGFPDRSGTPVVLGVPVPQVTAIAALPSIVNSSPTSKPTAKPADPEARWKSFSARFGQTLMKEPGANGRVAAIRGAPGAGAKAAGNYSPDDADRVRARAREILDAAQDILGLDPQFPLGDPVVKTGAVSAQVYYSETLGGVPLEPAGSVIVDLGPQGEILNVTSNYVSGIQVVNQRQLAAEQARPKAEAAVPEPGSALSTLGGNPVVWVTRSGPGGTPEGRQAYAFNVAGREVIVDAGNGQVLFRRDRRQY